jgi:hypothetical protein
MRKKGENSVERAGKDALSPDNDNDFTVDVKSQNSSPWLFLTHWLAGGELMRRAS